MNRFSLACRKMVPLQEFDSLDSAAYPRSGRGLHGLAPICASHIYSSFPLLLFCLFFFSVFFSTLELCLWSLLGALPDEREIRVRNESRLAWCVYKSTVGACNNHILNFRSYIYTVKKSKRKTIWDWRKKNLASRLTHRRKSWKSTDSVIRFLEY